ncbi:ATP-binding protein [Thiomicrorhabdus sp. Milos-T2]|uniref:AAA family ATPase n=1 Tax=Thiomicrorhabdus sp. Milos-T2 TaxID=90814 RepID=UPI00056F057E|nr:ATP-binding protein [Thiomicrorhabdus sp. Milos-T2]
MKKLLGQNNNQVACFDYPEDEVLAFWAAKILSFSHVKKGLLKPVKRFRNHIDFDDIEIILNLNFEKVDEELKGHLVVEFCNQFLKNHKQSQLVFPSAFNCNLEVLAKTLELSKIDIAVLRFFTIFEANRSLRDIASFLGELNRRQLIETLAWVLDEKQSQISEALSMNSVLAQTGLVRIDRSGVDELNRKVDVMSRAVDFVMTPQADTQELLYSFCQLSGLPLLSLKDYPHLSENTADIVDYLNHNRHKGMNILIYGQPGTGKTQWVKLVAQLLNKTLYEIRSEDEDGDMVTAQKRVGMYQLAQRALKQQTEAVLLFDEVEDVFVSHNTTFFKRGIQGSQSKSWLNTLLEENSVPAFWISNQVDQIDSAYLRRFDFVLEIETPPRSVRLQIIEKTFKNLNVSQSWMKALAEHKCITPALITRVAEVVMKTPTLQNVEQAVLESKIMERINAKLEVQGTKAIQPQKANTVDYSLEFLNTEMDLNDLVSGLQQNPTGRLCLYGLPGTGKTAFGHYVAQQLDRPLMAKRASDLLSPYVGEAEMKIAKAFAEAKKENAVLQIDEADSFLQNRENAQRSWEVTQVNELLTQMENFEGVLIASTNLMDNLDSAAMRRFDLKLEFKPLAPEQAWKLFLKSLPASVLLKDTAEFKSKIKNLSVLTPGDFAVINRKNRLSGQQMTIEKIFKALEEECKFKPSYQRYQGMGFMCDLAAS